MFQPVKAPAKDEFDSDESDNFDEDESEEEEDSDFEDPGNVACSVGAMRFLHCAFLHCDLRAVVISGGKIQKNLTPFFAEENNWQ